MEWMLVLAGIIGGAIVSVPIGVLIARHYFRRQVTQLSPLLVFQSSSRNVVSASASASASSTDDIEIRFKGERVPRVTRSIIALWNPGGATIDRSDIVGNTSLFVGFGDDGMILQTTVLRSTRDAVQFVVDEDFGGITWSYEVLDAGDGALVEVIHTAGNVQPRFEGAIKGIPEGPANWGLLDPRHPRAIWWEAGGGPGFILALFGFFLVPLGLSVGSWFGVALSVGVVAFGLAISGRRYVRHSTRRPPSALLSGLDTSA